MAVCEILHCPDNSRWPTLTPENRYRVIAYDAVQMSLNDAIWLECT